MKRCRSAFTVFVLCIIFVGWGASQGGGRVLAAQAVALPEAIQSFPSDFKFVFSVDIKKISTSPLYRQSLSQQVGSLSTKYQSVFAEIGLDPERDIDHVYGAGNIDAGGKDNSLAIISGTFDRNAITNLIVRRPRLVEKDRGAFRIFTITEGQGDDATEKSIVFLNDREVAIGDAAAVESLLDVREKKKPGIMSNPKLAALFQSVHSGDMIWFAGDAEAAIKNSPVKSPLEQPGLNMATSVSSVAGSLNLTDALDGTITAIAVDAAAAERLAGALQTLLDIARVSGDKNPQAKLLVDGLKLSRQADRIIVHIQNVGARRAVP